MKKLSLIVAKSLNNVIGLNNKLPWHYKDDLRRFKSLTMNHYIIVGRKTFESLPPLPGRNIIVVSSTLNNGKSLEEAISFAQDNDDNPFIAGGATIYKQALPFVSNIELTIINRHFEGDTFIDLDLSDFDLVNKSSPNDNIDFLSYTRKQNG